MDGRDGRLSRGTVYVGRDRTGRSVASGRGRGRWWVVPVEGGRNGRPDGRERYDGVVDRRRGRCVMGRV